MPHPPPAPQERRHSADLHPRFLAVVAAIPPGKVATYGQIAALAGLPGYGRHVGRALAGLPSGSDVPWQRVVNHRGEISPREPGWAGLQRRMLAAEGVPFDDAGRIDLARVQWCPAARFTSRSQNP